MTLVLNRGWGGFSLPQDFCNTYGFSRYDDIDRDDPRLIDWVTDHLDHKGKCFDLACVEIPDNATDWELGEYDGWESIIYVVDGKIHHA